MKFFKSKNKPKPAKQPEPRALEELTAIHNDLCRRAGETQYVISANKDELSRINEALRIVNNEAVARKELNAKLATKEPEQSQEARSNG